jgi:hypothetical protein
MDVFNFLFENRGALGIENVLVFKNLLLDGAIVLTNGHRLGLEIKLRMNWEKACQAEWEFRNFLKRPEAKNNSIAGGIVVFEEFSADWQRLFKVRDFRNGWSHWYYGHSQVEGLQIDLLQFDGKKFEGFPEDNLANIAPGQTHPD